MKFSRLAVALSLLLLTSCNESANKQRADIRASFLGFSRAFYAGEGEQALAYISRKTFEYYDRLLPQLRHADERRLSSLPPFALFACLSLRHRYEREELVTMDSRTIIREAFDSMTFPGGAPHFLDIGEILIKEPGKKSVATVFLAPGEKHENALVAFIWENGTWKMDLTSVFGVLSTQLEAHLEDPSASRAQKALHYLQVHENQQIGGEILLPVMP